ncbi:hypothetical protein T10_682 [Trichinella papuae]|uniref:Uncharacterized protein n=1 Tax=Trichinella papuae TaxID=268474 RepID=A0A0V1M1E3_9BILA|nr:hypothetical protein T10_682 [Trichinella papuae]
MRPFTHGETTLDYGLEERAVLFLHFGGLPFFMLLKSQTLRQVRRQCLIRLGLLISLYPHGSQKRVTLIMMVISADNSSHF